MELKFVSKVIFLLQSVLIIHFLTPGLIVQVKAFTTSYSQSWELLKELVEPNNNNVYPILQPGSSSASRPPWLNQAFSKVVFPVPEDVVMNRSYLPDLGFLTDFAFLLLPRDLAASGMVRLSRDLFESEQCVQYVSCEMTKVARRHSSLEWIHNFLQDFPFQGDVADRLRQGSMDAIRKINKRVTTAVGNGTRIAEEEENSNNDSSSNKQYRREDILVGRGEDICSFSCHPMNSLTKGLKILNLLHDLVRTVK